MLKSLKLGEIIESRWARFAGPPGPDPAAHCRPAGGPCLFIRDSEPAVFWNEGSLTFISDADCMQSPRSYGADDDTFKVEVLKSVLKTQRSEASHRF
jgi:hypothetical protein